MDIFIELLYAIVRFFFLLFLSGSIRRKKPSIPILIRFCEEMRSLKSVVRWGRWLRRRKGISTEMECAEAVKRVEI